MARDEWYPMRVAWWRNPKIAALSLEAAGLWAKGRSYIADNQLSGLIPTPALPTIAGCKPTRKAIAELTAGESPLWETTATGWLLHDYDEHEGQLEQKRRTDRDRQRKHRELSRGVTEISRTQTKTETETQTVAIATTPLVPKDVRTVFDVWVSTLDGARRELTPERAAKIKSRLHRYSLEDVCDAVRGWVNDPWAERINQNDITLLLRNGGQCEKFRDLWRNGKPLKGNRIDDRLHAMMERPL